MHQPESILLSELNKILWDFEIQTDHLIPARRPDQVIINKKKNLPLSGFCSPHGQQRENHSKKKETSTLTLLEN